MFKSMHDAMQYIFESRRRLDREPRGFDEETRDISLTRRILEDANLINDSREYVVVTGSRGKGSVTSIMAKLLQTLGYQVGMLTSPHLVHWNERIRINGQMIPTDDFLRILSDLRPTIDSITQGLSDLQYLSPQGIFLAVALAWFNENDVNIAVLEVGRGGRFDDVSVVPNRLAVFTPFMLEHTALLGETLERIAWHKAGITPYEGYAVTVPQSPEAMTVLQQEADKRVTILTALTSKTTAQLIDDRPNGQVIHLEQYGELFLPLLGRYQISNASLAIHAVEIIHTKIHGLLRSSDYIHTIREGLAQVKWLGRSQQLGDTPLIYIDGAITVESAQSFLAGVRPNLKSPIITIVGVPIDRDYEGVYRVMGEVSHTLIITENDINPKTKFPARENAIATAQAICNDVQYTKTLPEALGIARTKAGEEGTILLVGSLMLIGECMLIWEIDTAMI